MQMNEDRVLPTKKEIMFFFIRGCITGVGILFTEYIYHKYKND
ncbi:MAG: hypothetical protein RLZZ628_381 [Bacteroidota bacterium]|jgi:hypothetical protein